MIAAAILALSLVGAGPVIPVQGRPDAMGYGVQPQGYGDPQGNGARPDGNGQSLYYGDRPTGYGVAPPGYGVAPPGYGQAPPGYGQAPAGYGQSPGYGTVPHEPPAPPPRPPARPAAVAAPAIRYQYDQTGRFRGATETIDNVTREYDAGGRVVRMVVRNGAQTVIYDGNGKVIARSGP